MADYVSRLVPQVKAVNPVFIGVSFGGMIAVELAKILPANKIVLISSAEVADELPGVYRLAGRLRIHRLVSGSFLKNSHRVMNWIMGAGDRARRELLTDMLKETDENFLEWAIDKVVTWKNTSVPSNIFRIHGTNDKVLPLRKAHYRIEGGSHLIIANRAAEVSRFIKDILSSG